MNFTPKNPNFKANILNHLEKQFFMHHIQFDLTDIEAGKVTGSLKMEEKHLQQFGYLHGGVTATVADLVMGFAAFSLVSENEGTVTSDLKVSYLRPALGDTIEAVGYVIKQGNLLYFCEADIFAVDNGVRTLVARGYSTMCAVKIG
jgi:uncharacterized protein (TIGR00369 family)